MLPTLFLVAARMSVTAPFDLAERVRSELQPALENCQTANQRLHAVQSMTNEVSDSALLEAKQAGRAVRLCQRDLAAALAVVEADLISSGFSTESIAEAFALIQTP